MQSGMQPRHPQLSFILPVSCARVLPIFGTCSSLPRGSHFVLEAILLV